MSNAEVGKGFVARGGLWVVAQFALLALAGALPWLLPRNFQLPGAMQLTVAGVLGGLGIALFLGGLLNLGSSLTPMPYPREGSELRTDGFYRLVRHPVYGGIILGVTGYCLALGSVWNLIIPVLIFVLFDRKASVEEKWLTERYPEYPTYATSRRKLIPWLY